MPKDTFFNLKEDKRERILRSAITEFNACGFIKANIGIIARNAGVAKGSMYQYFEGKDELFVYCVTWSIEKLLLLAGGQKPVGEIDIFDYSYYDIKQRGELMEKEKEISVFALDVFMGKFHSAPHETIDEMMRVSEEYVLEMIKAGKKRGTVRADIDDDILSMFLSGATMKVKEYIARGSGQVDRIYEGLMTLLKDSIGTKSE